MKDGKLSSRKDSKNYIYSTGPDVCKTPIGHSYPPVPYSSIAFLGSSVRTHSRVRHNKSQDFHLNSRVPSSKGTEPGIGKGIKKRGHLGPAAVTKGSSNVASEGYPTVRHKDPAVINMASLGGKEKKRGFDKNG